MLEEDLKKIWEEAYFSEDCHEKEIIDDLPRLLKDSCDVFMDVGASGGQYTFFANRILENKTIIAVEADPIRYRLLNESCQEWAKAGSNEIMTYHNAIFEKDDESISFYVTKNHVSGSLFLNSHITSNISEEKLEKQDVKTLSLISLLEKYKGKKIFVKMDVEGAEFSAFKGAVTRLKDFDVTFLLEVHYWKDTHNNLYPWNIFTFFNKAGFIPVSYKKHFIVKKSNAGFKRYFANRYFAFIYFLRFILYSLKK